MDIVNSLIIRKRLYTNTDFIKSVFFGLKCTSNLKNLNVLESEDTISYLLENEKSFIRWGSGESSHVLGGANPTQKYDPKLSKSLFDILRNYNKDSKYLLGAPSIYLKSSYQDFKKLGRKKIQLWRSTRYLFDKYADNTIIYGDAFVFRNERRIELKKIEKIWKDKKVVLVAGSRRYYESLIEYSSVADALFIQTAKYNSFSNINVTLQSIIEVVKKLGPLKNVRVLVTTGPSSRVIVNELCKYDIISYDTGNLFEHRIKSLRL